MILSSMQIRRLFLLFRFDFLRLYAMLYYGTCLIYLLFAFLLACLAVQSEKNIPTSIYHIVLFCRWMCTGHKGMEDERMYYFIGYTDGGWLEHLFYMVGENGTGGL